VARSVSVPRRFSLAYLALAALLGVAVGVFVLLIERPAPEPPPAWSAWTPTATDRSDRQEQIANHVAAEYRQGDGKKLVNIVVRDPSKEPNAIQDIALTRTLQPTQRSDIINADSTERTAMYVLCGSGGPPGCAIKAGKPSKARTDVLRREALELALYTFRYLDQTDSVVAFFPPKDLSDVMYFTKADLEKQLKIPLRRTLARPKGPIPASLSATERQRIDELTSPRQFRASLRQESNGANALLLVPPGN
jgi:hypothetical protein